MITILDSLGVLGNSPVAEMSLSDFSESVRDNAANETILLHRDFVKYTDKPFVDGITDNVPKVFFQTHIALDEKGRYEFSGYNGLIAIVAGSMRDPSAVANAKAKAATIPNTVAAMTGADGRSVVILVRAQRPDGTLPSSRQEAQMFHAAAYQMAVSAYSAVLECPVDIQRPDLMQTILFPCDPEPYVATTPAVFVVAQPEKMPDDQLDEARAKNHFLRSETGWDFYFTIQNVLQSLHRQALENTFIMTDDKGFFLVTYICDGAALAELPEEEVVGYLCEHFRQISEDDIRRELRNAYITAEEKGKKGSVMPSAFLPRNQRAAMQTEEFVNRRYDIKKNEVTGVTEFRRRQSIDFLYQELTEDKMKRICHEAALEGLEVTDASLKRYILSDFIPSYNPVNDFLDNLPEWDGQDRITQLMQLVPTDNPYWVELGTRWFLSMVSHWMDPYQSHANSTAPILVGGQGLRKSTFCRNILPPELLSFYTDAIDFRNEIEAERYLSRFMLINIDEFDKLSPSRFAFTKHMFQKTQTAHRLLFTEQIANFPRYASFIGTTNSYDILKDPTGNRRFLCINVNGIIPTETPIDYPQLYAQAKSMIKSGVRCWIDDEDEARIHEMNKMFEEQTPLEELFLNHFRRPQQDEEGEPMRPIDIMAVLRQSPQYNREMGNESGLGRILTKLGFQFRRSNTGRYYNVVKL